MTVSEIRQQIKECHPDLRGGNPSLVPRMHKLLAALRRRCPVCGGAMPFARSPTGVARMTTCGFMCSLVLRRKPTALIASLWLFVSLASAQPPPLPALAAQPPPVQNPFVQRFGIIGDATGVDSYVVFIATNSITGTNYQHRVAFTNTAWLDLVGATNLVEIFKTNLVAGVTNYLRAMAVSTNGAAGSELSDEINYVPPRPPTIQLWFQEGASIDGPWRTLTNGPVEVEASQPQQFFRVLARRES